MNPGEDHNRTSPPDIGRLLQLDPNLHKYRQDVDKRYVLFRNLCKSIEGNESGGLDAFTRSYESYGIHVKPDGTVECLEWCPGAKEIYLWGEFNNWRRDQFKFTQIGYGKWKLVIPPMPEATCQIPHNSTIKLIVVDKNGAHLDRISPWARYVVKAQNAHILEQKFWNPSETYQFKHKHPPRPDRLRIYEAHVGIASPEGKVATYKHFAEYMLPRIDKLGYNCIQLMAVMEHAYYASFGYQITSFFAAFPVRYT